MTADVGQRLKRALVWPLLLVSFYVAFLIFQITRLQEATGWVQHTDEVIESAFQAEKLVIEAETGLRGYLLTEQASFLEPYENAVIRLDATWARLRSLVADNPPQVQKIDEIEEVYRDWLMLSKIPLKLVDEKRDVKPFASSGRLKMRIDAIRALFLSFVDTEVGFREARNSATQRAANMTYAWAIVLSLLLAVSFVLFIRREISFVASSYRHQVESLAKAQEDLRRANETLELRVHQRTKELEAANQDLEAFTYSVSHDLRAPFRGIEGFAKLLEDGGGDSEQGPSYYIQRIRAGVGKMGKVIDDLLYLTRISRARVSRSKIDLTALTERMFTELSREEKREAEVRIQPGLTISADPDLIRILMRNVLGNAWKYTSKKDRAVVEIGKTTKEGRDTIFVRDNGAGFNMRYAAKLFQPFEHLHSDDEFEGTGIGLAIAAKVIERHGGKIWGEGATGQGSTFYFQV